jgi:hypothetical protein
VFSLQSVSGFERADGEEKIPSLKCLRVSARLQTRLLDRLCVLLKQVASSLQDLISRSCHSPLKFGMLSSVIFFFVGPSEHCLVNVGHDVSVYLVERQRLQYVAGRALIT